MVSWTSRIRRAAPSGRSCRRTRGAPARRRRSDTIYHCGGGVSAFAIDPEGKMSICVLSQQRLYDLRARQASRTAGTASCAKTRAKKVTRPSKCTNCQIAGALLRLRRHRRARARRRRDAGRVLLRGRPPARAGGRAHAARARRLRVLRGRRGHAHLLAERGLRAANGATRRPAAPSLTVVAEPASQPARRAAAVAAVAAHVTGTRTGRRCR